MTNGETAHRLVISTRTAQAHVARILITLAAGSRTQVALWAVGHREPEGGP
ncbi:LuxR C-terminal-related transcriptional regulator [Kitasatospora sp. NPDC006697]|uniref:LuxR C-terminal-related transcriptional regulator n=1 Tax=Kitasatospora sp. NPDC006697 TaxID=3364020 RepID=UPI0036D0688E